jgi:hypothetical protein
MGVAATCRARVQRRCAYRIARGRIRVSKRDADGTFAAAAWFSCAASASQILKEENI